MFGARPGAERLLRGRFQGLTEAERARSLRHLTVIPDHILLRAGIRPGNVVLDVGAGTGLLTLGAVPLVGDDGKVIALDQSAAALAEALGAAEAGRAIHRVRVVVGDATALPLPDESADVALARSVLIYIEDKARVAREMFRVLRPGGPDGRRHRHRPSRRYGRAPAGAPR